MSTALERAGRLDIALLGIGTNGHLAFNEPGSALDSTVRRVELHEASRVSGALCWAEESPAWGLTLGLRELLAAPAVIVMANGTAKASIVADATDGPETADCPASFVRRAQRAVWVLDEAAASLLRR
jgi:glucosamine-6-phosphate deaminase